MTVDIPPFVEPPLWDVYGAGRELGSPQEFLQSPENPTPAWVNAALGSAPWKDVLLDGEHFAYPTSGCMAEVEVTMAGSTLLRHEDFVRARSLEVAMNQAFVWDSNTVQTRELTASLTACLVAAGFEPNPRQPMEAPTGAPTSYEAAAEGCATQLNYEATSHALHARAEREILAQHSGLLEGLTAARSRVQANAAEVLSQG